MLTEEMIHAFNQEYKRESFLDKFIEIQSESPAYLELIKNTLEDWDDENAMMFFVLLYFLFKKAYETKQLEG